MIGRGARGAAWVGGLLAALAALRFAATGELAPPPLTSLDLLAEWADDRSPAVSALALVRFAAELVVWYLLGLTLLHAVASVLRFSSAGALADALAVPAASRLVRAGLGIGLVASTAVHADQHGGGRATGPGPGTGTAAMQPVAEEPAGTATMVPEPAADPGPAVGPAHRPVPSSHQVEVGESFWTIAADVLEHAWGRAATDEEIDPFWRALVEVNRHRLVTDDPDLIVPGQVFEVPAVPAPPTGA